MLATHMAAQEIDQRATRLDLRLHAPMPDVVVVRVSGPLDAAAAPFFAERVRQQFPRARHVVVDLADVTFFGARGLDVLRTLHRQSVRAGVCLYVAADDRTVSRPLQVAGLDQVLAVSPCAELIVARLACRAAEASASRAHSRASTRAGASCSSEDHRGVGVDGLPTVD